MSAGRADLRLAPAALAAWLSAGVLVAVPEAAWWCAAAAGVAIAVAVVAAPRGWRGSAVLALTAAALAAAAVGWTAPARHPSALADADGHAVRVVATVASVAQAARTSGDAAGQERISFQATATDVAVGSTHVVGRMPLLVYADSDARVPAIGSAVQLTGTAKVNPSADDTSLLLYADGVRTTGTAPPWLGWANSLRARFDAASARLPGDGGALLPGLALGDESRVGVQLDADMKASSLSHLTAVSGSNCAVIVGGVLALGAACGLGRRGRVAVALSALGGFVVLVTPGASVLRAAVMATIVVLGTAMGRPGRAVPALALACLVLLVHDPWLARDYGFALSVAATAALLLLAPPLARGLARWLPRWLAIGLSVPIAAQLACQPILTMLNPTVPLYGVVANVLAEPAAAPATVIGVIGCLVLPFSAQLAAPLLWLAWLPAAWIAQVAHTVVGLPGSALPWAGGAAGVLLAVAPMAAVAVAMARPRARSVRRVRAAFGALCAVALAVTVGAQAGPAIAARAGMPDDWVVGLCDVGQGDAIVLHSGSAYGLIDTGPDPDPLTACLKRLGIGHLDLLVLTHYDQDHVGGLEAVAGETATALVGHPDDASALARLELLQQGGAAVHLAERGDTGTLGALHWSVLWPDEAHPEMATSNEGGVTLLVDRGGPRMLFLADLDAEAQDAVIDDGGLGPVDIVKVAHHGSAEQSSRIYGLVRARLGLISCGAGNDYGHPRAQALELLRAAGTQVARTDLEGTVLVTDRGGELGLWTTKRASESALWTPAQG
ncbi:ComEC/Rec2 family competence protein [Gryllotalpicola ginsengisoli]|uniref:ComEC/Rec2 family competence protein n=1 Tax=Gryllotalpicola ginsengisoli TaxID=444608 RepID=UPI0003B36A63|nr:ComEC/Rec2 family competence protein [Gryllotalpicola ginsengisoli]